jgi:hypothetical protein
VSCDIDTSRVAFCGTENISTPNLSYAAQYLAYALPCERFTPALADSRASLGAGAVRHSFTVTDFHRLPFAGLPAHPSTASKAAVRSSGSRIRTEVRSLEPVRRIEHAAARVHQPCGECVRCIAPRGSCAGRGKGFSSRCPLPRKRAIGDHPKHRIAGARQGRDCRGAQPRRRRAHGQHARARAFG